MKPPFQPLVSTAERQRVFGKFEYRINGDGTIKILGDWANKNIVKVHIPQLEGVEGAPKNGEIYFHKLAATQLQELFEEWDANGLMDHILTWAGSFVPRMIRGSRTTLSNHAFGTAFDINAAWNPLGKEPAREGEKGSVRELVEIAHKHGFYWGGNFSRKDGMHFEVAKALRGSLSSGATVAASEFSSQGNPPPESPVGAPELAAASQSSSEPETASQQTVESGAAGTQVLVNPTMQQSLLPVVKSDEKAIDVQKVEPEKSGSRKSIWATIWAGIVFLGLNIQAFFTNAYATVKDNPVLALGLIVGCVTVLVIYWKYQERQTELDKQRERQAHELTLKQMELAADQQKYSVKVVQSDGSK